MKRYGADRTQRALAARHRRCEASQVAGERTIAERGATQGDGCWRLETQMQAELADTKRGQDVTVGGPI